MILTIIIFAVSVIVFLICVELIVYKQNKRISDAMWDLHQKEIDYEIKRINKLVDMLQLKERNN